MREADHDRSCWLRRCGGVSGPGSLLQFDEGPQGLFGVEAEVVLDGLAGLGSEVLLEEP